jgi:hypothetical protein
MHPIVKGVYFVENADNFDLPNIAIRPTQISNGIKFEGNPRGFKLQGTVDVEGMNSAPKKIIVHTGQSPDGDVCLVKLTKKIYDDNLKKYVIGQLEFDSDEDVQNFYLNQDFNRN